MDQEAIWAGDQHLKLIVSSGWEGQEGSHSCLFRSWVCSFFKLGGIRAYHRHIVAWAIHRMPDQHLEAAVSGTNKNDDLFSKRTDTMNLPLLIW